MSANLPLDEAGFTALPPADLVRRTLLVTLFFVVLGSALMGCPLTNPLLPSAFAQTTTKQTPAVRSTPIPFAPHDRQVRPSRGILPRDDHRRREAWESVFIPNAR